MLAKSHSKLASFFFSVVIPGSTKPALLAETDKLDVMVTDEHLLLISQRMTNWQSIAPFLGLTEAEEEEIMTERKVVQR